MRSVNKVIIIGNVTRNPDTKTSSSGQAIATFGIATKRYWTTTEGEKRSSTEFHEVVAWARLAEICNQLVRKGQPVYIEGYLKTRTWEAEDGTRLRKTEIVIQDLIILEKRGDEHEDNHNDNYIPAETVPVSTPPPANTDPGIINIDQDLGL